MVDQTVGGAVVAADGRVPRHLGLDGLGQLLAELHAPLVVGVDVPDDALGEDLHLVHGDQRAQGEGRHPVHHDAVGRPVPRELLVRTDAGNISLGFASLLQLSLDCSFVLPLQ